MDNPFVSVQQIKAIFQSKGYAFFESGKYNLNLFGIRAGNKGTNTFDDLVCCAYRDSQNVWQLEVWPVTTDPGDYWLKNPGNPYGTGILVPWQYRAVYAIDKHAGKYDALCQRLGPVKVYRDANRDSVLDLDPSTVQEGLFGINIHRSNPYEPSNLVNKWSAGCQVHADPDNFGRMMSLARKAWALWGNAFTYTLFTEQELSI